MIATPAQTEAELKTAPLAEINKAGEEKPVPEEALAALAPPLEPTSVTLPKTASPFVAVGLAGLIALIMGGALRFAVSRVTNR